MRRRLKLAMAKLMVAALLLQLVPVLQSGAGFVYAGDPEGSPVTVSVYGDGASMPPISGQPAGAAAGVMSGSSAPIGSLLDYEWENITTSFAPDPREMAAMAYDEQAGNVVLFGGQGSLGLFDDTWIWDGEQQTWAEVLQGGIQPITPRPSPRKAAAMAYDPVSGKVLLFGGEGGSGALGDTWLWDGLAQSWSQLSGLPDSPSARGGAQIAYDGQQLVLFGGYSGSASSATPLGDTWLWDGQEWIQANPTASPPPTYFGSMAYDGGTAVLFGGNLGTVTREHTSGTTTQTLTYNDSSDLLWIWDRDAQSWDSVPGPIHFGRWGHAMAYDGRRTVFLSGELDFVNPIPAYNMIQLNNAYQIPSNNTTLDYNVGKPRLAFGWTGSGWEQSWNGLGSPVEGFRDVTMYPDFYEPWPYSWPISRSYASMAFDGRNFILFGGNRVGFTLYQSFESMSNPTQLAKGVTNETWVFGYTPPEPPSIRMVGAPVILYDDDKENRDDKVSVVIDVYGDGGRTVIERGLEYRLAVEPDDAPQMWNRQPYTGSSGSTGAFTGTLESLVWQKGYEVRGYAVNELGTSYTDAALFTLEDHPYVDPPDVVYERVGPSVLHVKDKKRIVAVGTGIFDLLRKPPALIDYYLEGADGSIYPLSYNIKDMRQLELTWEDELAPGTYDVRLKHGYFDDYEFEGALLVTALDFYKPRNFGSVEVPSTSIVNKASALVLQGPFTEDPSAPKVYVLSDLSEVVAINESVRFKGSRLEVDKTGADGFVTISGEGRLYVNASGTAGAGLSYTLLEGEFELTSDRFSIDAAHDLSADYLNMGLPIRLQSFEFTPAGLLLSGDVEVGFRAGSQHISDTFPIDSLMFRNNRFELAGAFELPDQRFKVGPLDASGAKINIDSRYAHVDVSALGRLPHTNLDFKLNMWMKRGQLDSVSFGMFQPARLDSTGLQIDYMYGTANGLADYTELPQRLPLYGSVSDILVPELRLPGISHGFRLMDTGNLELDMAPYGFSATGSQYLYWLPVPDMKLQAVSNPSAAGLKGFSLPGFTSQGPLNVYGVMTGTIHTYSFNKLGFAGQMTATVHVPKGIPHVGGATIHRVVVTMDEKGMYGSFKHNNVGVTLTYTFSENLILFELRMPPPKPPAWLSVLEVISDVADVIDMFTMLELPKGAVSVLSVPTTTFRLTQTGKTVQPAGQQVQSGVAARIVPGMLTAWNREHSLRGKVNAADGGSAYSFDVKLPYTGLIVLSGDQRDALVSMPSGGMANVQSYYHAATDTTLLQASFHNAGTWKVETKRTSSAQVHELLFAHASMSFEETAELWLSTPDREVTALTVEDRGNYMLEIGTSPGEALLYKPDGRPYSLQTQSAMPDWNAYRDTSPGGSLYVLLDAAEQGTWLIDGGAAPEAALYRVQANASMADASDWVQNSQYPTAFQVSKTGSGQAIVEIYGADEHTQLYKPDGDPYPLVLQSSNPGWNAAYDPALGKLTVLLQGNALIGEWTALSSKFADVVVYTGSRSLSTPKLLLAEGTHTMTLDLPEAGNYLLALSGAGVDTVITAPGGKPYPLVFDEQSAQRNASIQPAEDRAPEAGNGSDPVQIAGPASPIQDGRDTLYVSLLNAAAGKWTIRTSERISWEIREILPIPEFTEVAVTTVPGADNSIRLAWSVDNAAPGTAVAVMLTDSEEQFIGEVIAEGLPAAGQMTIHIPEHILPGVYRVSVFAHSEGWGPIYAIGDSAVTVTAPVTLGEPRQPEVLSTGNGEVTLDFESVSGPVALYRIWAAEEGGELMPIMDVEPSSGPMQQAVAAGLPVGKTYIFAVSAIGFEAGRIGISPVSETVTAQLPAPQPAGLSVVLDGGAAVVKERSYTAYYGVEETLLITAAEQAVLQVTADQLATVTLNIRGGPSMTRQVSPGNAADFPLHELLGVSSLAEREYELLLEAVNGSGDRSEAYRKLFIDRTGPLLIASNGYDNENNRIELNGAVVYNSRVYMMGQTDSGATLTVDGRNVPLDDAGFYSYYAPLDWADGDDRKVVSMKAEDEAGNITEYGFEVVRGIPGSMPEYPGELAALTASGVQLIASYRHDRLFYQAAAINENVRIYAAALASDSSVTVDGQTVGGSGYVEIAVPAAGRTVQIAVQPVEGIGNTYTMNIAGFRSDVAVLSNLELRDATDSLTGDALAAAYFSGLEDSYTVYVGHEVEQVVLTPQARQPDSSITVNGHVTQNGQASLPVGLQTGVNVIPVAVTAPDLTTVKTYQISVWRAESSNARLQQLELNGGGMELYPSFNPDSALYRATVPHTAATLSITAAAEHPDAVVRIGGQTAVVGSTWPIPLTSDIQNIQVEVEAQDGTLRAYSIIVLRQQAAPQAPPRLSGLNVSGGLDSPFSPYRHTYTSGSTMDSSVSVTAEADDPSAVVTMDGLVLEGGGLFHGELNYGMNVLVVNVESPDLATSQTYSIAIERLPEDDEFVQPGTPRTVPVVGGEQAWQDQVNIFRTRNGQGWAVDTLKLDGSKTREIVDYARRTGNSTVRIHVTDLPGDPADERFVSLDAEAVRLMAAGGLTLEILLPEGRIVVPAQSLADMSEAGRDMYFRVVPVKEDRERGEIEARVLQAELVRASMEGGEAVAIGRPVKIETNYSGIRTELVFPLQAALQPADEAARERWLSELAVYIEHSDGDKALQHGSIVYDESGNAELAIEINKFSVFTIIQLKGSEQHQTFAPYLSGYPDGTFRPSQLITRAELATVLHRALSLSGSASGSPSSAPAQAGSAGFADVPSGHWALEAIQAMRHAGIMVGDPDGRFRPEDTVTRAEMASIAARWRAGDASGALPAAVYSDVANHWAEPVIAQATAAGLLQGYPDGTFRPDHGLNRAEAVTVLNRLFKRPIPDGPYPARWPDVPGDHWALADIESASGEVLLLPDGRAANAADQ